MVDVFAKMALEMYMPPDVGRRLKLSLREERQKQEAWDWVRYARRGSIQSGQTTALIVHDNHLIGSGSSRPDLPKFHSRVGCIRRWLRIPSGRGYWVCPGCASYDNHAEMRAVIDALSKGNYDLLRGSTMYLTHYHMCDPCKLTISTLGIEVEYVGEVKPRGS